MITEEELAELERILKRMEELESKLDEDLGLVESFRPYKEGIKLHKRATELLNKLEKEILLIEEEEEVKLKGFEEITERET